MKHKGESENVEILHAFFWRHRTAGTRLYERKLSLAACCKWNSHATLFFYDLSDSLNIITPTHVIHFNLFAAAGGL